MIVQLVDNIYLFPPSGIAIDWDVLYIYNLVRDVCFSVVGLATCALAQNSYTEMEQEKEIYIRYMVRMKRTVKCTS